MDAGCKKFLPVFYVLPQNKKTHANKQSCKTIAIEEAILPTATLLLTPSTSRLPKRWIAFIRGSGKRKIRQAVMTSLPDYLIQDPKIDSDFDSDADNFRQS